MVVPAGRLQQGAILLAGRFADRTVEVHRYVVEEQFQFVPQHEHLGHAAFDVEEALFGDLTDIGVRIAVFGRTLCGHGD